MSRFRYKKYCEHCGKKYNGYGEKFCSMDCYRKDFADRRGSKTNGWKGGKIKKTCERCSDNFYIFPCDDKYHKNRYCSKKCYNKTGKDNPNWRGGLVQRFCNFCGKEFQVKIHKIKEGKGKYCSRECFDKVLQVDKVYSYPTKWTKDLTDSIRKRDNYMCQECGIHQDECDRRLDCHHIDYDKNNLDPKNLISLCRGCHTKTNHSRDYWENYFNKINI